MKVKITKRRVDALSAKTGEKRLLDTEVKGFGLRVRDNGPRTYFIRYQFQGERHYKVIGVHGSPWNPDTARTEAQRIWGLIADGIDPKLEAEMNKNDVTISVLCDRYIEDMKAGRVITRQGVPKSASTIATDEGRIKRHIKPLLGRKKVKNVTRRDIIAFRDAVTSGATKTKEKTGPYGLAIVKGGSGTATRTLGLLSGIFAFAVKNMMRDDNPVHGVERAADKRKVISISATDYAAIGDALASMEEECDSSEAVSGKRIAIDAIRALLLSGCRKTEILCLTKTSVDYANQCIRFEDTKTGAQVRPAGQSLLNHLESLQYEDESPWVFPASRGEGHIVGVPKVWEDLRNQLGLKKVTLHTFRHGYASVAAELGYSEVTIAGLLGHRMSSVTGRYIHLVDPALIAAADDVSARIEERLNH